MLKKIGYVFSLFCFLIIIGYCLMKLFSNPKPDSNTAEGLAEYGYVEGQVNEIRVGGVLLRFPAGVKYHPHTNVKFVKGEADDVETGIFYPDLGGNNSLKNGVPIHLFSRAGDEDPEVLDKRIEQENWKEIIQRDDLDLIEYHRERDIGSWGYITYVAKANDDRTPKGSRIGYVCDGYPDGRMIRCMLRAGGYVHESKLKVSYQIQADNMKNWKAIHAEVVKFVDSIIVEE